MVAWTGGKRSPALASTTSSGTSLQARRYKRFLSRYPEFVDTVAVDDIRRREFARLDEAGHVYLDYTGGGLYSDAQILRHADLLRSFVFGNPHSANPTSSATSELVERSRAHVMQYFRASPEDYVLIFTANASQALKLVGESYPFSPGDQFLLTFDNHNSVNGIREFDRARGASTTYVPVRPPEMRLDEISLRRSLARADPSRHNLFAFPAQSNFSGVQHPLEWIPHAQEMGWDVLLDAAAFVPTNRLDLTIWKPDYVAISFYKMFGYPTGIGALLVRHDALRKLHRPWFSGGTISQASVQADSHKLAPGATAFEDGTLDYTNLPAVDFGLEFIESVGIDTIHMRVRCLTSWLLSNLLKMRHPNGHPLVEVYGPLDSSRRGGTVAMNFLTTDGYPVDDRVVEHAASNRSISLRTGCFCNPGAGELALGFSRDELLDCFEGEGHASLEGFRGCIRERGNGAVRVSLGIVSNFRDVERFLVFCRELTC